MHVIRVLVSIVLILASPISIAKELQTSAVYLNGFVYTVDDSKPRAQAFAIADKRFIAVGKNSEMLEISETHLEYQEPGPPRRHT